MRNQQAGGVVSFIIVVVALTGLLVGGLYLSKSQGRSAREGDTSTPQVAAPAKEDKKDEAAKPSETTAPAAPAQPQQNQPATGQGSTTPPAATNPTSAPPQNRVANTGPSDAIPATGPGETTAAIFSLGILTFAGYRFAVARRTRRTAALSR